ncbi:host cell division inhibitory peptide Kil [Prodigiosinella confusarubida]|uniref:Host cell division inhibitory peptide Kil n=1 Tax=Serratia sp. (strain ATCC 39006) TaxID=104623 RepID=A0A2I5T8K5_SERS3|nr:host cell division inhibitory peptide Kil [Serratia sp. ATCC 39006]AUH00891.1 host cell division inhibitory peptide Kil [Serratia sp. ATCC 39006]AUH04038.1 host cell division inhibitory peptide Kil [Serratia sp. ATCC 39006]AUH05213.1 host cell division inhibitory peptide Kil [Serratia sp. ATCC 39006]
MINHQQLREAQRMAAAAVSSRDKKKWEEAKRLFRQATGRTLH